MYEFLEILLASLPVLSTKTISGFEGLGDGLGLADSEGEIDSLGETAWLEF